MKKYVLQTLVPFCYYIGIGFFNTAMAFDAPPYAITHQLTHTFELKPISSDSYQISKATFLPDYVENGFSGNKLDDDYNGMEGDCKNIDNLYTTKNCTYPKAVVAASLCPFLPGHYTRCECLPQFKITSCNTPYIFGGDNCDGKYEKCVCPATVSLVYANDECISYCEGNCIDKRCIPSADQKNCTNSTEPCDDGCGGTSRKCCIPCSDKITSKPDNSSYTYSSCTDGNGAHQIQSGWTCNSGYHEKNGACEKDCIANNCSGYDLTTCPENGNCSKCTVTATNCSTDGTKYKLDSCQSGYSKSGNTCVKTPETCDAWIKENYPDYTVYTGGSYLSSGKIAVISSGTVSISDNGTYEFVGPKIFNSTVCQNTSTPTLTITNPTKALVSADSVNLFFDIKSENFLDSSCKWKWEYCKDMSKYSGADFTQCMQESGYNSCSTYDTVENCCSRTAAIDSTSQGTMTINNASIKATSAIFKVNSNQTLKFTGTSSLETTCAIRTSYGCRAIFAGGRSRTVNVTFDSSSNTNIKGCVYMYYSSKMTVNSKAVVNINSSNEAGLFVNQNGYTPTYYADQGVHNYGTIKTNKVGFHAGQINNYSGSAFSTSSISVSSSYPGRIKNTATSKVQIGGVCRSTGSNEYKFTSNSSSNPFSGSGCSI